MGKQELCELPQIKDRLSFLYLEKCRIKREENALVLYDKDGMVNIPIAMISVLLLGPGTDITHRAVELIGDNGVTVIWVGEMGVRFYASGKPLTHSSLLLEKQAKLFSNQRGHLEVVKKMYQMRYPDEDTSDLNLQQLRGREGSRVRSAYRREAKKWGVDWKGRNYEPGNISSSDPVNQCLSIGNSCLYGLAQSVITSLGCSPGLGFIHVGHENSFTYDIADLYKEEITIPLAFYIGSQNHKNLSALMRKELREKFFEDNLIERMVHDIKFLLSEAESFDDDLTEKVFLWDKGDLLKNGILYGEEDDCTDN